MDLIKVTNDEINLINGDMVILDKINKRKNRKKKSVHENINLLDDLYIG